MSNNKISFYKGNINIFDNKNIEEQNKNIEEQNKNIEEIKKDIVKIFSSSHLSFLLGAGCSADAIPIMSKMWEELFDEEGQFKKEENLNLEKDFLNFNKNSEKNLEKLLEVLLAKQFYLENTDNKNEDLENTDNKNEDLENTINHIKNYIFNSVNPIEETEKTESLYKSFYKKLMYRENTLSKVNIFTTNYDLFNEKAMDDLGIVYCNGFSGNVNRYFNPMTFNYAYAEQIGLSNTKYNVLDKYVYLYKLHGSINWIEDNKSNQLFKIKEIQTQKFDKNKNIMIYPTPTKQNSSLSSPYSDLFREFQKKLLQQDNILVVIGYSFTDEHINNIIYQALATIPKFRLIIFSHDSVKDDSEIGKLKNMDDPRIWVIQGKQNGENIASFKYIVKNFLIEENEDDKNIGNVLEKHIKKEINKK